MPDIKEKEDVNNFPPRNGKIRLPVSDFVQNKDFSSQDGSLPKFDRFVGRESQLIFYYLGMTDRESMAWLEDTATSWSKY